MGRPTLQGENPPCRVNGHSREEVHKFYEELPINGNHGNKNTTSTKIGFLN